MPAVAQPDQMVVAVGDRPSERSERGAPIHPAGDPPADGRAGEDDCVADDQWHEAREVAPDRGEIGDPSEQGGEDQRPGHRGGECGDDHRRPGDRKALAVRAHLRPAVGERVLGVRCGKEGSVVHRCAPEMRNGRRLDARSVVAVSAVARRQEPEKAGGAVRLSRAAQAGSAPTCQPPRVKPWRVRNGSEPRRG